MGACNRQNNTASRVDERSAPPGGPTCEVQSILFPDINVSTNNWTWITEFNTQKFAGCRSVNCSYYGLPGILPTSSPTWRCDPTRAMASSFLRFLDHTQRRTTVGRNPLDERSTRRGDLYLTQLNTYNRQTSMPSVGLEPTNPASQQPQTHALHRAATSFGPSGLLQRENLYVDDTFTVRLGPNTSN